MEKSFRETFDELTIKYLKDTKKELEEMGYIPTLDVAIWQLEESLKEVPKCDVEGCNNIGQIKSGDTNWCYDHAEALEAKINVTQE